MQKQASEGQWQRVQMMVSVTLIIIMKTQIAGKWWCLIFKERCLSCVFHVTLVLQLFFAFHVGHTFSVSWQQIWNQ
jgi:hypothetical protein